MIKPYSIYRTMLTSLAFAVLSGCGGSDKDVSEKNQLPVANAGIDQQVNEQTQATLSGQASDADGTVVIYSWSQTSGTTVTLTNENTATAQFTTPDVTENEDLVFQLNVEDNEGAKHQDSVTVEILKINNAPIANAGSNKIGFVTNTVTLDGSSSSDDDNDSLSYQWELSNIPETSNTVFTNATSVSPSFVPDVIGSYTASLVVSDGDVNSEPSLVTITVGLNETVKVFGSIIAFDTSQKIQAIDNESVAITINLLDSNDDIVHTVNLSADENPSVSSELRFSSDISSNNVESVSIDVRSQGYTSSSRRLPIADKLTFDAKLLEIPTKEVTSSSATSISGEVTNGFNLTMLEDVGGEQVKTMSISIPSSLLPEGTSNLSMAVATYDPNDPDDAEYFPGAYEDSDGQELVSVAFNFAEITTNTNETIGKVMAKVRTQKLNTLRKVSPKSNVENLAEEPVIINRTIPASSCSILESMGDSDANIEGFQIPIYVYNPNSGLWDLIGQGTIFDSTGSKVTATTTSFDCATATFTMEILVTSDIFLSNWWNLDYPILFAEPQKMCADIQLTNTENELLSGVMGFVSDKDNTFDFSSTYFLTDNMGKAQVCVTASSGNTDNEAEVYFYNPGNFGSVERTINIFQEGDDSETQVIEIDQEALCFIEGKVTNTDQSPVSRHLMYALSEGFLSFNFSNTDENGYYNMAVSCGVEHTLHDYSAVFLNAFNGDDESDHTYTKVFSIDGNLASDEVKDDGSQVTMSDFTISPIQPYIYSLAVISDNTIDLIAYANPGDFPIEVSLKVRNEDGSIEYADLSGQFVIDSTQNSNDDWFINIGTLSLEFSADTDNTNLYGDIVLTDAKGNTWTPEPLSFIVVPQ